MHTMEIIYEHLSDDMTAEMIAISDLVSPSLPEK